jgi:RHS repeat-associated protein
MRNPALVILTFILCLFPVSSQGLDLSSSDPIRGVDPYIIHHWPDPVNVRTGAFTLSYRDIDIPFMRRSLGVSRNFNSVFQRRGSFGYGWMANFDLRLVPGERDIMEAQEGDGSRTRYHKAPDSLGRRTYVSAIGASIIIFEPQTNTYVRYLGCDSRHIFDKSGRLLSVVDASGNRFDLKYDGNRLTTISDSSGRSLTLSHTPTGLVSSIEDPLKRVYKYYYDRDENLVRTEFPGGVRTHYTYDDRRNLIGITYPDGSATAVEYDPATGRVTAEKGPGAKITRMAYEIKQQNPLKQITLTQDALGNRTQYHFDQAPHGGLVLSILDAMGGKSVKTFDEDGKLISFVDPNGHKTSYEYDELGRLVGVRNAAGNRAVAVLDTECGSKQSAEFRDASGGTFSLAKDPTTGAVATTDPLGRRSVEKYDSRGLLRSMIDSAGATTEFEYDPYGNIKAAKHSSGVKATMKTDVLGRWTSVTDSKGREYTYKYDDAGRFSGFLGPQGYKESISLDGAGRITQTKNSAGDVQKFVYDEAGQIVKVINELGDETHMSYDAAGNRILIKDPRGNETRVFYDKLNRIVKQIDPSGREFVYGRDPAGNVTFEVRPGGQRYEYQYNEMNQLVRTSNPNGAKTELAYDPSGNLLSVKLPGGRTIEYSRDQLHRLVEYRNASGKSWKFEYDEHSAISRVTDPQGRTQTFKRNPSGFLIGTRDYDGNESAYSYNELGLLAEVRNSSGIVRRYEYDDLNRKVGITILGQSTGSHSGKRIKFDYDVMGRVTRAQDESNFVHYQYDASGRIVGEENSATGLKYRYIRDENGNVIKLLLNEEPAFSYTYDNLDRLTSLTNSYGETFKFHYEATGEGNRSKLAYPNGVTAEYGYDVDGRLVTISYKDSSGKSLLSLKYRYDPMGNVLEITEDNEIRRYDYDDNSQLIKVTGPNGQGITEFKYDEKSNLVGRTTRGKPVENVLINKQDRLLQWGQNKFHYDRSGRLVEIIGPEGAKRFLYDISGNLERVILPDLTEVSFGYDPIGNRIMKRDAKGTAFFGYRGMDLVWELDENRHVIATFTHGPSPDEPLAVHRSNKSFFYHADRSGNIRLITDSSGQVVERLTYDPFGEIESADNGVGLPYRFSGKTFDRDAGLYDFWNRLYMPDVGRFIEKDPLGYASMEGNYYAFVQNNPMSVRDPFGLQSHGIAVEGGALGLSGKAGVQMNDPFKATVKFELKASTNLNPTLKTTVNYSGAPTLSTAAEQKYGVKDVKPSAAVGVDKNGQISSVSVTAGPIGVKANLGPDGKPVGGEVSLGAQTPKLAGADGSDFLPKGGGATTEVKGTVIEKKLELTGEMEGKGVPGQMPVFKGNSFPEKTGNFLTNFLDAFRRTSNAMNNPTNPNLPPSGGCP